MSMVKFPSKVFRVFMTQGAEESYLTVFPVKFTVQL